MKSYYVDDDADEYIRATYPDLTELVLMYGLNRKRLGRVPNGYTKNKHISVFKGLFSLYGCRLWCEMVMRLRRKEDVTSIQRKFICFSNGMEVGREGQGMLEKGRSQRKGQKQEKNKMKNDNKLKLTFEKKL